jgi:hypothetical protein
VDEDRRLLKVTLLERIRQLTSGLESEVLVLRTQSNDAQPSARDCNQLVEQVCAVYMRGLQQMQAQYNDSFDEIQKELRFLKELSDSQRIMMQSKVDYIKELEERNDNTKPGELS